MISSVRRAALALLSSTAVTVLSPAAAPAVVVTVGGSSYDISLIETSQATSTSLFSALPPQGRMPWWGDPALAYDFAVQVYDQLGDGSTAGYGPLFAHGVSGGWVLGILQSTGDPLDAIDQTPATNLPVRYAIASAPVPGPLPLFGVAAAFGWSRRLRQRIGSR